MTDYKIIEYPKLRDLCIRVFEAYEFTPEQAVTITDVLLAADLAGIESHGVQRLVRYDKSIRGGEVVVHATPETVRDTPVSATIEAHKAMGQLVSTDAMNLAIAKAKTSGIGIVAVRNSTHYGIAGHYTGMALEADMFGMCMTNTEAIMVPTWGKKAMIGTNAWAIGMPADPVPFSFDAAMTVVPRGKVEVYAKRGKELPDGWAIDENGLVCTDPLKVLENVTLKNNGGQLPLGGYGELNSGHKGYAFGVIVELLSAVISGGDTAPHVVGPAKHAQCHSFWAIDYGIFGDKATIRADFSAYLQELRDAPKADGQERIYIAGEKERESRAIKQVEGIPVNDVTFGEIRDICGRLGVDMGIEW